MFWCIPNEKTWSPDSAKSQKKEKIVGIFYFIRVRSLYVFTTRLNWQFTHRAIMYIHIISSLTAIVFFFFLFFKRLSSNVHVLTNAFHSVGSCCSRCLLEVLRVPRVTRVPPSSAVRTAREHNGPWRPTPAAPAAASIVYRASSAYNTSRVYGLRVAAAAAADFLAAATVASTHQRPVKRRVTLTRIFFFFPFLFLFYFFVIIYFARTHARLRAAGLTRMIPTRICRTFVTIVTRRRRHVKNAS